MDLNVKAKERRNEGRKAAFSEMNGRKEGRKAGRDAE